MCKSSKIYLKTIIIYYSKKSVLENCYKKMKISAPQGLRGAEKQNPI